MFRNNCIKWVCQDVCPQFWNEVFFLEICESLRQVFSGLQVFMSDENVSNNSINDQQYGICNSYLLNVKSFDFFPMGFWSFFVLVLYFV